MYQCKSHPDKFLVDHLFHVRNIGLNLFNAMNYGEDSTITKGLEIALLFHDFGKASTYFQEYLRINIGYENNTIGSKEFLQKQHDLGNRKQHGPISAVYCYYLLSRKFHFDEKLSYLFFFVVKRHHSNLQNAGEEVIYEDELIEIAKTIIFDDIQFLLSEIKIADTIEEFITFLENFRLNRIIRKVRKEFTINDYFLVNLLFSIIVRADKADCIIGDNYRPVTNDTLSSGIVDEFKKNLPFIDNTIFSIRNSAYTEVNESIHNITNEKIFSINLPTGAGKTLIAINAALKLKNKTPGIDRIIYCLPFTSVIDQTGDICRNQLFKTDNSDIVLLHHHLVEFEYKCNNFEYDDFQSEFLITNWDSEFIITTFYQFLHSILTHLNKNVRKLVSLNNAVIIMDEVQTIPQKYWKLINNVFTFISNVYNIRFILVTATLPLLFRPDEITELAPLKEKYFTSLNRIILNVTHITNPIGLEEFVDNIIKQVKSNPEKSILIILNTIKSSIKVYTLLKENGIESLYLSTNIIPKERFDRIDKVKKSKKRMIVVSTQLVEAGVDIDFDIVYRDFAPLDAIFQTCGRCNRNSVKGKGIVYIFLLEDNNHRKYCSYVYDIVNRSKTLDILKSKSIIEEKDFYLLSIEYYNAIAELKGDSDSDFLLKELSGLNYKNAFTSGKCFQLIEAIPKATAFIAVDTEAEILWNKFQELMVNTKIQRYEKKMQIRKLLRKMGNYMISIRKLPDEKNFYYVSPGQLEMEYNQETGFILDNNATDCFF
ncbi:MAG: CRISPR-associated helicase Cas3' [Spirochaetales bacterium]|nr:CRISPR-associated helicase Cas3' [Spirochaetales bacterium]